MKSVLCAYIAKKRRKALSREFGAQETDIRLLADECSRLKTRVNEVESTMKETLELVDKLQLELGEVNASKLTLENWEKSVVNQVALLHFQVLELQS